MKNRYTDEQIINGFINSVDKIFATVYSMLVNNLNKDYNKKNPSVLDSKTQFLMKDTPDQLVIKNPGIEKSIAMNLENYLKVKLQETPVNAMMNSLDASLIVDIQPFEYKGTLKQVGIVKFQNGIVVNINITNRSKIVTQGKTK